MAGWRAPAPAREYTLARGTLGKHCRDFLRAAAPGRNLRNWPRGKLYMTIKREHRVGPDQLMDDHDHDRGHGHGYAASPNNASGLL